MFRVLLCLTTRHDPWLIGLALCVCLVATGATFWLYGRAPATAGWRRWNWLAMTGLVSGSGIWTTHFVAMLAFKTGLPVGFSAPETLGSLLAAIVSTTLGFTLGSTTTRNPTLASCAGGAVVGLGITFMHFLGMAGYRTAGVVVWDPAFVLASVAVGASFATAALLTAQPGGRPWRRLAASGLLVAAITGMHLTGMTAITIVPDPGLRPPASVISEDAMATLAVAAAGLILVTAIGGIALDAAGRQSNHRRLREALDAVPEGLAFYDASDRLVAWNAPYEALCRFCGSLPTVGLSFDELLGAALRTGAFQHAQGRGAAWAADVRASRSGSGRSLTHRLADGRWLQVTDRRTDDGGTVTACVDVTEQKLAQMALGASEERFRRMAENAPAMITECTLDGVMTYVSPASLPITGYAPEELVGRPFASLMDPQDAAAVQRMCQTVFASKGSVAAWPVEFRARRRSGAEIWLECKPTLIIDPETGRFTGLTDVVRDITSRKALEADLRFARAEAETAATVKTDFLANMSHELRTPLTSIIGFTGLVTEQPELSAASRTYVQRISDASRALLSTVNDLLDFSKLEAGQLPIKPTPVVLQDLLHGALELLTPQADAKDLDLFLEMPSDDVTLLLDPNRLRQILLNLLGNAVKFTSAGSVTLRAGYDGAAESLTVTVIDTGDGIAADKIDQLFRRFSQVDGSLKRSHGGTGLGLAICKGLVEAMGGVVGVESEPGRGSAFWFRIPAKVTMETRIDEPAPETVDGVIGLRVLVVDDHPANRELARLLLTAAGVEVAEAGDGEAAAILAETAAFDAILMDLNMPVLDGPRALKRIRASAGPNRETPILAFTASADGAVLDSLGALGFHSAVAKPLDAHALLAALARASAPRAHAA